MRKSDDLPVYIFQKKINNHFRGDTPQHRDSHREEPDSIPPIAAAAWLRHDPRDDFHFAFLLSLRSRDGASPKSPLGDFLRRSDRSAC